jgi:hypothetical protein
MQRRLTDQNVNLASFTDALVEFFVKRDFEATKGETEKGFEILAYDSPHFKLEGYADVTVEGESNDFVVSFELHEESKRSWPTRSVFLTTMLGGGYFLLKRLKSDEAFLKLEREFWTYVAAMLPKVKGSAEESS